MEGRDQVGGIRWGSTEKKRQKIEGACQRGQEEGEQRTAEEACGINTEPLKKEAGQKVVVGGEAEFKDKWKREAKERSRCKRGFCDAHFDIYTIQMCPCAYVHSYENTL